MTTLAGATSTLYKRLQAAVPGVPIWWPNSDFRPPGDALWVQVQNLWGQAVPETMRPPKLNRISGQLRVIIYAPQGQGDGPALRLADTIRPAFNRLDLDGVRCDVMSGAQDHSFQMTWYSVLLTVNYTIEESE
jgi:hypothetical protein